VFGKNNFIERSILGALTFLKESIFADEYAMKPGLLQSLDPRVKIVTFLLFIIQVLLTKNLVVLLFLYVFCLLLAYFSKVSLGFFLKRTWVFIPLFSLFIAIPALFSIFSPGDTLVAWKVLGTTVTITRQGLGAAGLFVTRVILSVSFAVLLSITTRHFVLLQVLRIFKIPQIFVMTLGMCYRYVYLFVEIIENTYLAIKSRVGGRLHYKKGQSVVAWNIAFLWQRSFRLNEDVYKSMLSRGYCGEPLAIGRFKAGAKDWIWLLLSAEVFLLLIWIK
jgi:cobalt/nickel transport system permease protein